MNYTSVLRPVFGENFLPDEPLARYTQARLGGPADALVIVHTPDELEKAAQLAWMHSWPVRILGGGANVLVSDGGFRGLVIINRARQMAFATDGTVTAESGAVLSTLTRESMARGLSGFEWAINVPGTLGGAVVNNAGAHGGDISQSLVQAEIAIPGKREVWRCEAMHYAYRESSLKRRTEPYAVLTAVLQLSPGHDPSALHAQADEFTAHRKRTQPPGASLGSMFKNPPGDYAGRLIEAAGLKGTQFGGVVISPLHANFFVNKGGGTASDYLALIRLARDTVREKFGVTLALEIEIIGEDA